MLWWLALALVLCLTTWFSASAVIPQVRVEWRLSDGRAAWLTIAVQLGFVAGSLGSSILNVADVFPARRVIVAGAIGAASANALILMSSSGQFAVPLRFATGFFLAGVYPPALKLIATWFRRGRGAALGILVGAVTLGTAMPHLVNALGGLDWKTVILATSLLTLAGSLIVALRVREGPFPFPKAVFDPRQARLVLANRGVRLASLGYFGHMWELYAMWAWFVVFFADVLRASGRPSGSAAAFATFLVIGVGALGCWGAGVLGDRVGRERVTSMAMLISGVCAATIGLFTRAGPAAVLAIGLVWGVAVVADSAQFSTLVTELADQVYVGTALTLQLAVGFTLTVATIWLIPHLENEFGWRWAFAFLVPGPAVGVAAMRWLWMTRAGRPRGRPTGISST
jgi:MFS family permease